MIRRALTLLTMLCVVASSISMIGGEQGGASPRVAGRVRASFQPNRGKIFVLVIGSDARRGNPPQKVNGDGVHVIGVNTKTSRAGILNFPRDSWVTIPGHGKGRINQALSKGGPRLLARTVKKLTGIQIDYWVLTAFDGFQAIVRSLGGVKMHIGRRVFDPGGSGARIKAGTRELKGWQALAYVRTRHSFPRGDVDRTTNHGRFLLALLRKLHSQIDHNPAALLRWMAISQRHVRFDIGAGELFRLAVLASQIAPKNVGNVTVPVSAGSAGSASVVFISGRARAIYKRFKKKASL